MVSKRNPYLILGVPFGASRDVASRAFAGRARGLRRVVDGADQLTDLTWALNQIEEVLRDPEVALDIYRVPADPGALEPDHDGLFSPKPEPLARRTAESDVDQRQLLEAARAEMVAAICAEIARYSALPAR